MKPHVSYYQKIRDGLLFDSLSAKAFLRANLEAFFHIAKQFNPAEKDYLQQVDDLAAHAIAQIKPYRNTKGITEQDIAKAEKAIRNFVFKQKLAHDYLKKFTRLKYYPYQSEAGYKRKVAEHYKKLLLRFLKYAYKLEDAEQVDELREQVKARFIEMVGHGEKFLLYKETIKTIFYVRTAEINSEVSQGNQNKNREKFFKLISNDQSFPDAGNLYEEFYLEPEQPFKVTQGQSVEEKEIKEEKKEEDRKREPIEQKEEVKNQPNSVWKIQRRGDEITVLDFPAKASMEIKAAKKQDGKSGHESFRITAREIGDDKDKLLFFKLNKNGKSLLSSQEVIATRFWNVFLPEYSSSAELAFDEQGKIIGVISLGIEGFSPVDRNMDYQDKRGYLDFYSLAGVWTFIHTLCEDDAHRENLSFISTNRNGQSQLSLFKIDGDMTLQSVAEAGAYGGNNKRGGRFNDGSGLTEKAITVKDCVESPMFTNFNAHFLPGKSRLYVGGSSLLENIGGATRKGWGNSRWGIHRTNLKDQHQWLSTQKEYIKWKWYHYARFLFTDMKFVRQELEASIANIKDPDEKETTQGILKRIYKDYFDRGKKFSETLSDCILFKKALFDHRDEYLTRMALDNVAYWRIYKCQGEINVRKLICAYDGRHGERIETPKKIKCSWVIIRDMRESFQKSLEACRTVAELEKLRNLFTQLAENCEPSTEEQKHSFEKFWEGVPQKIDERIPQLVCFEAMIASIQQESEEIAVKRAVNDALSRLFDLFEGDVNNPFYQQAKDKIFAAYFDHPAIELAGKKYIKDIENAPNLNAYRKNQEAFKEYCQQYKKHPLLGAWYKQQLDYISYIQPKVVYQQAEALVNNFFQLINAGIEKIKEAKLDQDRLGLDAIEFCDKREKEILSELFRLFNGEENHLGYQKAKKQIDEVKKRVRIAYCEKFWGPRGKITKTKVSTAPTLEAFHRRKRLVIKFYQERTGYPIIGEWCKKQLVEIWKISPNRKYFTQDRFTQGRFTEEMTKIVSEAKRMFIQRISTIKFAASDRLAEKQNKIRLLDRYRQKALSGLSRLIGEENSFYDIADKQMRQACYYQFFQSVDAEHIKWIQEAPSQALYEKYQKGAIDFYRTQINHPVWGIWCQQTLREIEKIRPPVVVQPKSYFSFAALFGCRKNSRPNRPQHENDSAPRHS